ncbi:MAG: response regulator transcription factor [Chitinophagaceae bacterium]|nr:response regulator transcription factor [Chitinophagaceae bacterium]MCB0740632.1 response regulator transcription factor [Chitinophagaceae bacterium]
MKNEKYKVLVVEDEPLIFEGIKLHLNNSNFSNVVSALDYEEALDLLKTFSPDITILDINLSSHNDGIQIAEYINTHCTMPFIYLTSYSDKITLERAKATAPAGFIVKPFNKKTLLASLEIAMNNFQQQQHIPALSRAKINRELTDQLSNREFEILQLLYDGKSNKEIGQLLFIAMNTVKRHVTNIYFKLDVKTRTEAIALVRKRML